MNPGEKIQSSRGVEGRITVCCVDSVYSLIASLQDNLGHPLSGNQLTDRNTILLVIKKFHDLFYLPDFVNTIEHILQEIGRETKDFSIYRNIVIQI